MSWSLTDLWNWLQGVTSQISNFFSQLWTQAQNIVNTGQGIFLGLSQIGSSIWDALRWVGSQIYNAFAELVRIGEYVYNAFKSFGEWVWRSISNLPNAIYSALQWIYNGLIWAGKQIMKALEWIYNWLVHLWNNFVDNVTAWYEGWRNAVNAWWTNIWLVFRQKLKRAITANIAIPLIWKSAESIKDKGIIRGGATFFASLFIAPIAGYTSAEIIDALIPTPSTTYFELLPPLSIPKMTPPPLTIPEVEEKPYPEKVPTPSIGYGLPYDISLALPPISLEYAPPIPPYNILLSLPSISQWAGITKATPISMRLPLIRYEYDIISPVYKDIQLTLRPLLTTTTYLRVPPPPYSPTLPSISLEYVVMAPVSPFTLSLPSITLEWEILPPYEISLMLPSISCEYTVEYTAPEMELVYEETWDT